MISLDIRGLPEIQRALRNLAEEQMPYAISTALNSTAFAVQKFEKERMPSVFDRPTPFISSAFRVEKATKQNLTATVYVAEKQAVVLKKHEEGGQRGNQRMEWFLKSKGWLPSGWRAIATDKMPRNSYGNPSQAEITKLINGLPGISGIAGDNRRVFVIPQQRGHLSPGVYRTLSRSKGKAVVKLYHFVSAAQYRARLEFVDSAKEEAIRILPGLMTKAVERAIATAR